MRPAILSLPRRSLALDRLWLLRAAACRLVDLGVELPRALLVAHCLGPLALCAARVHPRSLSVLSGLDPALLQPAIAGAPSPNCHHQGDEDDRGDDYQNNHKRAHMTSFVVFWRVPDDRDLARVASHDLGGHCPWLLMELAEASRRCPVGLPRYLERADFGEVALLGGAPALAKRSKAAGPQPLVLAHIGLVLALGAAVAYRLAERTVEIDL